MWACVKSAGYADLTDNVSLLNLITERRGTMNIPGFTAEESVYKTSRHYQMSATFNQADVAIHPALVKETDEPVGWQLCVEKCKIKCFKDKACNQMAPAAKTQCKLACEDKCISYCTGLGSGTPTGKTCEEGSWRWKVCNTNIPAIEVACWASWLSGPWCSWAADAARDEAHCEVC
jgi:hypothetical protein